MTESPRLGADWLSVTAQVADAFDPRLVGVQDKETEVTAAAKTGLIDESPATNPRLIEQIRFKLKK